jgi:hypothetical protein
MITPDEIRGVGIPELVRTWTDGKIVGLVMMLTGGYANPDVIMHHIRRVRAGDPWNPNVISDFRPRASAADPAGGEAEAPVSGAERQVE